MKLRGLKCGHDSYIVARRSSTKQLLEKEEDHDPMGAFFLIFCSQLF
jgi:hypothetical protein